MGENYSCVPISIDDIDGAVVEVFLGHRVARELSGHAVDVDAVESLVFSRALSDSELISISGADGPFFLPFRVAAELLRVCMREGLYVRLPDDRRWNVEPFDAISVEDAARTLVRVYNGRGVVDDACLRDLLDAVAREG